MKHEPVPEDGKCPIGYSRIGCCKCILAPHAQSDHIGKEHFGLPETEMMPVIHGSAETHKEHERQLANQESE